MSTELFKEFIDTQYDGNQTAAAAALGLDGSMVSRICSGARNVSPAVALRIEQVSGGRYAKEAFIWPADEIAS